MLARIQIPVFALGEGDLLLVVSQFERCGVLGALEVLGADLSAEDARLRPVLGVYAEANLVEYELGLLFAVHGAEGLDLQLAEDVTGGLDIAIVVFFQIRQNLGDSGTLDLDEDLSLCDGAQGFDDLNFSVDTGNVTEEVNDRLDHLLDGLLELAMFLGEDGDLITE